MAEAAQVLLGFGNGQLCSQDVQFCLRVWVRVPWCIAPSRHYSSHCKYPGYCAAAGVFYFAVEVCINCNIVLASACCEVSEKRISLASEVAKIHWLNYLFTLSNLILLTKNVTIYSLLMHLNSFICYYILYITIINVNLIKNTNFAGRLHVI